jgi:hypothetical protein
MTLKTESADTIIVSLEGSTLAVTELVGMGSYNCAVFSTTCLAWGFSKYFK